MFQNIKITAQMATPVAFIDPLRFDCILSAAYAKSILGTDYFTNGKRSGNAKMIIATLSQFLAYDEEAKIFHASCAIGDSKEFVVSYSKRWTSKFDDKVAFKGKGKQIIDTSRGQFKSYHKNIIYKPFKEIVFYAVGDIDKISALIRENIHYLGKKSSQGFGHVKEWTFEIVDEDRSIMYNDDPMRFLPVEAFSDCNIQSNRVQIEPLIPPAWRNDCKALCFCPGNEV